MTSRKSKFHGVSIVVHASSCAAATLCRNHRYLAGEAPRLPLPECDRVAGCRCTFKHYEDRRTGLRRAADMSMNGDTPRVNRRTSRGRRESDRR